MVDFLKIKDFISILPILIIYILPGYVFISIKDFIVNKKKEEDKNLILKCIVISYIIINFEYLISSLFKKVIDVSSPKSIILTLIFSIVISYICSIFIQSELSSKALKKIKISRSLKTDIMSEIVDFESGMWIKVFLSTEQLIYLGKLRRFEKIGENSYDIVLSNFILYNYSGDELLNNEDFITEWVFINVKENYRIELSYNENSKKITN
ncbi:hypothetical protein IRP63_14555 (plasmid) [Clostridium botulinum]|uniref:Uncharacterized protein n=2 Tax=Clostridium botulinum TaxID=1491 RepID=A0A9Q1ZBT9_CLOBO|nr:hypothetical protein [Clostridium botulinum]AEB77333.1 hypothetical protein CbC4_4133 [Clostridium botulinum BKT015925]KEH96322.1 hypothetical protein Y848_13655 [Clostridium botulinum C/D str. Sp77]KEH96533.1 hypothetical protein Z953_p0112 [Clostridium botulinum D str. 16868]KGM93325.1 hypothetical protein Z955_15215 [Clostridium botulinum C/D str. DC5]KLU74425.1 hypothetical protein CBC3_p0130 [Clostridium botulinum V891]